MIQALDEGNLWNRKAGGRLPPLRGGGSLDRCGIGLASLLLIGLAPAFLIRRCAPPCPFAVPCGRLAAEATALSTDRCTRLCSASSATGSAEQRGPRGKAFRCGGGIGLAGGRLPPLQGAGEERRMANGHPYEVLVCTMLLLTRLPPLRGAGIVRFLLSIVHCPLSIVHCPLPIIHYPLSIVHLCVPMGRVEELHLYTVHE